MVEMPADDEPEVTVLGRSEDLGQVAPNTSPSAAGTASASEGGPGAESSEGPPTGGEWAMVQHWVPSDFNRNEWEQEKVWRAQYEVGS